MVYQLHDQQDAGKAISQIQEDATVGQLKVADFQWFIITIQEAIYKNLKVDLRCDSPTGLVVQEGTIKSAELIYDSANPNPSTLTINFNNKTTNKTETIAYVFNAELTEENTNSVPGDFMKYYLKDDNHNVIVGIVVRYK